VNAPHNPRHPIEAHGRARKHHLAFSECRLVEADYGLKDAALDRMDCKLEGVVVPVEDVDRSKRFYAERLGFQLNGERRLAALVA
jgi:hypothetical protein